MPQILVDADGCPVKQETYRVARRHRLKVVLVANTWMATPEDEAVELVIVGGGFDEADDWIADHCAANDIVVTTDIPLAARCLKKGAYVVGPKGREFTEASIGDVLATRDILSHLREHGVTTGGPAPFSKQDRSRFLQTLDVLAQRAVK
jgi:uncharacterized protein